MDYKEKLKAIINSNKTPIVDIDTFLKYFPELKESKDERIRKELLVVIDDLILPDEQKERFVAWLERQAEQKSAKWDDEDERRLSWVIDYFNPSGELYSNLIYWFKSLKDRIQQSKQELSEEDEY